MQVQMYLCKFKCRYKGREGAHLDKEGQNTRNGSANTTQKQTAFCKWLLLWRGCKAALLGFALSVLGCSIWPCNQHATNIDLTTSTRNFLGCIQLLYQWCLMFDETGVKIQPKKRWPCANGCFYDKGFALSVLGCFIWPCNQHATNVDLTTSTVNLQGCKHSPYHWCFFCHPPSYRPRTPLSMSLVTFRALTIPPSLWIRNCTFSLTLLPRPY